jgi:hypothetical protein
VYSAVANASISYNVQIIGAPNVYVPVHIGADITAGAIHATDDQGNNYELVDNPNLVGPNDGIAEPSNYEITSGATITILQNSTNVGIDGLSVRSLMFGDRNTAVNALGQAILIDQTYFFLSNTDITIQLTASATLSYSTIYGVSGNQYGNVSASADPIFTISDPAFANFSIVGVPDGAGPPAAPAVPEPATWTIMLIGFGAIGMARWRRRAENMQQTA